MQYRFSFFSFLLNREKEWTMGLIMNKLDQN